MKIILDNNEYQKVFRGCHRVLNALNFDIQHSDERIGIISAIRNDRHVRVFDLKFSNHKKKINLIIIPGIITRDFECISLDKESETFFIEKLLIYIKIDRETNSFRLKQEDYLAAISL